MKDPFLKFQIHTLEQYEISSLEDIDIAFDLVSDNIINADDIIFKSIRQEDNITYKNLTLKEFDEQLSKRKKRLLI